MSFAEPSDVIQVAALTVPIDKQLGRNGSETFAVRYTAVGVDLTPSRPTLCFV
jgi:hypothetical protein